MSLSKKIDKIIEQAQPPKSYFFSNNHREQYDEKIGDFLPAFVENGAQLIIKSNILFEGKSENCSIEMWMTKMLIRQRGNQPKSIQYMDINFAVVSQTRQTIAIYTYSLKSHVLQFKKLKDLNSCVESMNKLSIMIINSQNYQSILELIIKKWQKIYISSY